jgi:hypothetical protein
VSECPKCGFPAGPDGQGGTRHVNGADAVICEILFSGGSLLDSLLDQED